MSALRNSRWLRFLLPDNSLHARQVCCLFERRSRRSSSPSLLLALAQSAPAEGPAGETDRVPSETFAVHGQFTYVEQDTSAFNAPYSGPHSLSPRKGAETTDATLAMGARLWRGAEIWINPEIDQGFGLDDTLGVAGFPSGEAYKVGKNQPYLRLPRFFVRDTVDLAGDREPVAAAANWLADDRSVNRWVFTVGKFSVIDVFDTQSVRARSARSIF